MRADVGQTSKDTPPGVAATALTEYFCSQQERLVDRSIQIAKDNGYAPYTTTIRAAWVEAIQSVTRCLGTYLAASGTGPDGAIATRDYQHDARFSEMRRIARLHRSLGITLQLYLGLFKHFRNIYLDAARAAPARSSCLDRRITDFFDEAELSIAADWTDSTDEQRIRELQARTRSVTLDKDRYFAVFESLRNPAFLLDRSHVLVNANQAAAELFLGDAEAGEIIYLRSMRRHRSMLQDVVSRLLSTIDADADSPVWLETLAGERCFDVRMRALHDAVENTTLGHVVLLNDVTTYRRATESAQQAERAMSRFLATMTHEIRTPLHSVLGAADLLRTSCDVRSDGYLDMIESAGQTLLQTLNNVLDYSKLENSRPVARPAVVDLRHALDDFWRVASVWAKQRPLPLDITVDNAVARIVRIDWAMTQQVLTNLVSNAIRHDDGSGVRVCVGADPEAQSLLLFEILDHGPGIADAEASVLREAQVAVRPRDTGNGGAGLGLAIARRLVEAMGGRIGFENQSEETRVWFRLPLVGLAQEEPPAQEVIGLPKLPRLDGLRCLLIDDDAIGTTVTMELVSGLGAEVDRAQTLSQAQLMARDTPYDAYIVDYALPDGKGPDFVSWRRGEAPDAGEVFLALTANAEALNGDEMTAQLFDAVLAKPADRRALGMALLGSPSRATVSIDRDEARTDPLSGVSDRTVTAMRKAFADAWLDFRERMSCARATDDLGSLREPAHRLAGSCAFLGLIELEKGLLSLEELCQQADAEGPILKLLDALDHPLDQFAQWEAPDVADVSP